MNQERNVAGRNSIIFTDFTSAMAFPSVCINYFLPGLCAFVQHSIPAKLLPLSLDRHILCLSACCAVDYTIVCKSDCYEKCPYGIRLEAESRSMMKLCACFEIYNAIPCSLLFSPSIRYQEIKLSHCQNVRFHPEQIFCSTGLHHFI